MAHELYFLPILLDAIDATSCREALREAISKVISLGREPGYELGYQRFNEFMKIVGEGAALGEDSDSSDAVLQFLVSFCSQLDSQGLSSEVLLSDPIVYMRCQQLVSSLQHLIPNRQEQIEIIVESGNEVLARFNADNEGALGRVRRSTPGKYSVSFSTGRKLWEGILTKSDLTCEGQPLSMAADDNGLPDKPALEIVMLSGEIVMKVYRGIESGALEIVRIPPK